MALPQSIGTRLAYDRGASAFVRQVQLYGGGWVDTAPEWVRALNSENGVGAYIPIGPSISPLVWKNTGRYYYPRQAGDEYLQYCVLFPEPLTITGVFASVSFSHYNGAQFSAGSFCNLSIQMQVSENTFNGVDGDWSDLVDAHSLPTVYATGRPASRWVVGNAVDLLGTEIKTASLGWTGDYWVEGPTTDGMFDVWTPESELGVRAVGPYLHSRAVRISFRGITADAGDTHRGGFGLRLQLYGQVEDSRAGRKFLAMWHPHQDRRILPRFLDWGSVIVSSSGDKSFRIKNMSAAHTAYGVTIRLDDPLWQPTPFPEQQFLFSTDRIGWYPEIEFSAISPGAASPRIYVRRVTPINAALLGKTVRISCDVGTWI